MARRAAPSAASPATKSQECQICLEELRQDLAACPCGHVFHHICILQAMQVNKQCPSCRRQVNDADVVSLYLDVPGLTSGASSPSSSSDTNEVKRETCGEGDSAALSARVNSLMERVQWQNKQQELLVGELQRLRSQSELLLSDKQTLAQRVHALETNKTELLHKVAKYQMELSRQAEAARRLRVNQSIVQYLETCDATVMEDELQNPRELIMALKKACKFRHDQYQKVVKDKTRLKAMLQQANSGASSSSGAGKAQMRSCGAGVSTQENKRAFPGADSLQFGTMEHKKRKSNSNSVGFSPLSSTVSSFPSSGNDTSVGFTPRSESAGFRANAYSDVNIRPASNARQTFGRSSFNPNQYGAYNLTAASGPPVQLTGNAGAVCRRGYDETGKLTNFFLPKTSGTSASLTQASEPRGLARQKAIPSMQNLLNAQSQAGVGAGQRGPNTGRQDHVLTSWLHKNG